MADTIVSTASDDNYGFNLEWIAEGSGIGEVICGVDKDCIVTPSSPIMPKMENGTSDYIEIQVTEEEVIAASWDDNNECVSELEVGSLTQDVLVPLDEEQDEYSRLHPYPCDFCSRRFAKQSSLTVHMLTHQTIAHHNCNLCGATYNQKLDLVEHMKIHSYAPIKLEPEDFGDICSLESNFTFQEEKKPKVKKKKSKTVVKEEVPESLSEEFISSFDTFIKQEYVEEPDENEDQKFPMVDPSRPYVCQFCGVGFAREKALMSHKLIHAGNATAECDRCGDVFQNDNLLKQHMAAKHAKPVSRKNNSSSSRKISKKSEPINQNLSCETCHMVFSNGQAYVEHKNNQLCSGLHSCAFCSKDFIVEEDLEFHIKESHTTTNVCPQCYLEFDDPATLSSHVLIHNSPKKNSLYCNQCCRKFSSKTTLKRHVASHETKEKNTTSIICTECGASNFADGRTLLYHRQIEHGLNMSRLFPCVECGKTFNSRSSQQIHIRIHTGERPYACRFCWKAFGDGGTLRKHERIHTGEKPYVCPVCCKAFNQRVVLREHVRAHHSGKERKLSEGCYECMVCGQFFGNSDELCAHLVQHSDENTAKHRQFSVRKTYPMKKRKSANPASSLVDFGIDEEEMLLPPPKADPISISPPKKKTKKKKLPDASEAATKLSSKNTLESWSSCPEGKMARIVRSGKKGFHKGQNKRYLNRKDKGKTSSKGLSNGGSYASKYAVSQPTIAVAGLTQEIAESTVIHDESQFFSHEVEDDFSQQMFGGDEDLDGNVRTGPRTKNVSYHNMKVDHKNYDLATFSDVNLPSTVGECSEADYFPPSPKKKKSCKKKKKPRVKTEVQAPIGETDEIPYINGINVDPPSLDDEEQIETSIVSDDLEIKQDEEENAKSCQLCNGIFPSSEILLKHLQTHF